MKNIVELPEQIFVKPEFQNPGLSHKHRVANLIISRAKASGQIKPGRTTIIEKTGGNFGLGLLFSCKNIGIDVELAVGLSFSHRKRKLLEFLGARLIGQEMLKDGMTPKEVVQYHLNHQKTLGKEYFYTDQFENQLGVEAHRQETGAELAFDLISRSDIGNKLVFISGAGTGASLTGISLALKGHGFEVTTILVEPDGCDMRSGQFQEHRIEGISVGVPAPFLDWRLVSGVEFIRLDEVIATQKWFFLNTGLLVGNSSAANIAVARKLRSSKQFNGIPIITLAYDSGLWYDDFMA